MECEKFVIVRKDDGVYVEVHESNGETKLVNLENIKNVKKTDTHYIMFGIPIPKNIPQSDNSQIQRNID